MASETLIISPHLDDAVLSAGAHLIGSDAPLVVTVFAGIPEEGAPPGWWDRLTRAADPAQRVRDRLLEDAAALAELGARTVRLDGVDGQHREHPVDPQRLAEELLPFVEATDDLWIPAGIGNHQDHTAVRDAALIAHHAGGRGTTGGARSVHLYADVPYAIRYPWSGAPGAKDPDLLDAGFWLEEEMRRCGLSRWRLTAEWSVLPPAAGERKLRALARYRTQWDALEIGRTLATEPDSLLRYELSWRYHGHHGA